MTSGYVLILAILVLGGVIATVGDRLGMRVGKARLSLFNLRPRQTAVLITILTGSLVSASTLGILLAIDEQLRTGVFELGRIQSNLRDAREELNQVRTQKQNIEDQLTKARAEQLTAQQRLDATNRSLDAAIARQEKTQKELQQRINDFQQAKAQLGAVTSQVLSLRLEINQLQADRQRLVEQRDLVQNQIAQRDRDIAQRDRLINERDRELTRRNQEIAQRDQDIARRSERLKELELVQTELEKFLRQLEFQIRLVRSGDVRVVRGQLLASGVLRIVDPAAAGQAVDQLLKAANRVALQLTQPGTTPDDSNIIIRITAAEVDQLIEQIKDGRDYVVQVFSVANYVLGEQNIRVVANATPNRLIYAIGEVIATSRLTPVSLTENELRQRIEQVLAVAELRAQRDGILESGIQVGNDATIPAIIQFTTRLKDYDQTIDIQVVAADNVYNSGPLKVQLVALQAGKVLFQTE
ncbi:MAG: DUF3084 domain-containing protein [Cyanobacteria bacterium]|nr:DUF3084 domain-containing protein [Cyanobacteriota bacterium]MDW8202398.1 DUF3084 domain-containing protein [Cyanobacteriota bacterium SKYGB_h_bin112]